MTDRRCPPLQQGKGSKQTDRQTDRRTADANLFSRVKVLLWQIFVLGDFAAGNLCHPLFPFGHLGCHSCKTQTAKCV